MTDSRYKVCYDFCGEVVIVGMNLTYEEAIKMSSEEEYFYIVEQ